jgi:hypothetical protein
LKATTTTTRPAAAWRKRSASGRTPDAYLSPSTLR